MCQIILPVRKYEGERPPTLTLDLSRTALVLVDCDTARDEARQTVLRTAVAPVLRAAREARMRVVHLHQSAYGAGGPDDVTRRLLGHKVHTTPDDWRPTEPSYDPLIAPQPDEPDLPKCREDGFSGTHIDYYLRTWNVDSIVAVGFRLKCCLVQTCQGARRKNYRVVMLRDCTCPPGAGEYPDTLDAENPEGGWMRFVFLRMFETLIGYTATSADFIAACGDRNV